MSDDDNIPLPLTDNGKPAAPHRQTNAGHRKAKPGILVFLFIPVVFLAGAVGGAYWHARSGTSFFTDAGMGSAGTGEEAAIPYAADEVVALGRLLPYDDLITISPPYGAGDARLETLLVEEGDRVSAGQIIATLDNRLSLSAVEETARAQVAQRQAALEQVRTTVQAGFLQAQATYGRAEAGYKLATAELARVKGLREKGVVSQAAMDKAETAASEALSELERAKAALSPYAGIKQGRQTDILLAERNLEAAEAELRKAETDLAKGNVVADSDGVIIAVNARIGERPGAEGIALLGNTDNMKVELEVYQSDIRYVAVGQPVRITAPALGETVLTGRIARLGLEVKRQQLVANDPAANTDARVVLATVTLGHASSAVAGKFTGLQVTGRIITRKNK